MATLSLSGSTRSVSLLELIKLKGGASYKIHAGVEGTPEAEFGKTVEESPQGGGHSNREHTVGR